MCTSMCTENDISAIQVVTGWRLYQTESNGAEAVAEVPDEMNCLLLTGLCQVLGIPRSHAITVPHLSGRQVQSEPHYGRLLLKCQHQF